MIRWIKRIIKYALLFMLVVIIALAGWLSYYYVTEIRPYKPIIEEILANADPENRNPPDNIVAMIDADFYIPQEYRKHSYSSGRADKSIRISKQIEWRRKPNRRYLHRIFNEWFLANTLIKTLTEHEKNALIAELSYAGAFDVKQRKTKDGLNAYALFKFNKPLSELNLAEAAEVVAMLKAPSWLKMNPDKLEERTTYLLQTHQLMLQETSRLSGNN